MKKDVIIRRAKVSDLKAITTMFEEQGKYHARLDPLHERGSGSRPIRYKFARASLYSARALLLVAEVNGTVVGFTRAHLGVRPSIYSIRNYGYIDDMYIIPNYRRSGIAKKMLVECSAWFRQHGMAFVELSVHMKNQIGRNAWRKYGFKDAIMRMRKKI